MHRWLSVSDFKSTLLSYPYAPFLQVFVKKKERKSAKNGFRLCIDKLLTWVSGLPRSTATSIHPFVQYAKVTLLEISLCQGPIVKIEIRRCILLFLCTLVLMHSWWHAHIHRHTCLSHARTHTRSSATVVTGFCSSFPLAEFPFPLFSSSVLVHVPSHSSFYTKKKFDGTSVLLIQCIQAKISKTLDKRSTLIFAANCTEQELSSSESYYLTPNL